jgi:hypothetical protein
MLPGSKRLCVGRQSTPLSTWNCRALVCRCQRASSGCRRRRYNSTTFQYMSPKPTTCVDGISTHATVYRPRLPLASPTYYPPMLSTGPFLPWTAGRLPLKTRLKICTLCTCHTQTPLLAHAGSGDDALIIYKRKHSVQCKRRDLLL